MSIEVFLMLFLGVSVFTGLFTEAIKKTLEELNIDFSNNLLAGIVAVALSVVAGAGYMILAGITPDYKTAVYMIGLTMLSWLSSMVGYDKVMQAITQIKKQERGDNEW